MSERVEASGTGFWGDADDPEARRRYRTLVNAIDDGIYQLDAEAHFVAVNEGLVELTGYAREELLGEHVSLLLDHDGSTAHRHLTNPPEQSERVAFTVRTAEGDRVRCDVRTTPLEADGAVRGTVGVVRETTHRERPDRPRDESDRRRDREQTVECERELRETKTRLETAASVGSVGTWTWDVRENVVTADGHLAEWYGVDSAATVSGVPIEEFFAPVHETDRERVRQRLDEAVEGTGQFETEYRVTGADGDALWVVSRGEVEYDGNDEPLRVSGATADITERKDAEAELKRVTAEAEEQKRLYETIISSTPDLIYAFDLDYRFTFANDAVLEMWGQTHEESIGKTLREIGYEPWHAEMHEREIDEVVETKEPVRGEVSFPHAEHGRRIYDYIFAPVLDDDGEVEAIAGTTRDITDRKRHERALEESEQRYRTLAENFPNGAVGVYDRDLRYTLAEGSVLGERLPSADRLEGDRLPEIFPEETVEEIEPVFRTATEEGETANATTEFGGRNWQVWAAPLRDADGDIFAGLSLLQDVTERVERERELEERTERLDRFASMLAHELRNPVTIGQIYSQQLPADTAPDAVEYVTEAFDRIEDMIDIMLVVARGQQAVGDRTRVRLSTVAREAWNQVDSPEATLEISIDNAIQADETYVQHLFRNLFENAVEHGGADVTVTVGDLPSGFYVADDGIGIPAENRDAVFEAGYTTTGGQEGIGLGLTFVRELADVYDWECAVTESAAGGVRFEFTNTDQEPQRT